MSETIEKTEIPQPQPPRQQQRKQESKPAKPEPIKSELDLILEGVEVEVAAQEEQWGEQLHPLNGGVMEDKGVTYYAERAAQWKAQNDRRVQIGAIGWDGILLEEVYEAISEADPAKQLIELEQVAAVAVNAIRSLKRQMAA